MGSDCLRHAREKEAWARLLAGPAHGGSAGDMEAGRAEEKTEGAGDWAATERWAEQLLGHGKESKAELGQIQEREKRENKIPFLIFSTQFQIQFKSKL